MDRTKRLLRREKQNPKADREMKIRNTLYSLPSKAQILSSPVSFIILKTGQNEKTKC